MTKVFYILLTISVIFILVGAIFYCLHQKDAAELIGFIGALGFAWLVFNLDDFKS